RRIAVVEDTPGVTRDRLYGETEWNGKRFTVVDTGGMLFSDEDPLVEQIRVQAEVALAEADAVLFLTYTISGVTPDDSDLANAFTGEQRAIVSNIPGTTRDAIDTLVEYRREPFRLIDTAGLRRKGKIQGTIEYYMADRATRAIERADCALVVIDGSEGLTDGDKRIAKLAHDSGKAVALVVNKWDVIEPTDGVPGKTSALKKALIKI